MRGLDIERMLNSYSRDEDIQTLAQPILMMLSLMANPERLGEDDLYASQLFDTFIKINGNLFSVPKR